jgi:cytochrome b561
VAADRPPSWSRAQRLLHWSIAGLVLTAAPIAVVMVALPFTQLLLKFLLYQAHKTIGLAVLLLALAQLMLHWRRGRPEHAPSLPGWHRRAAAAAHGVLFALLLAVPVLGYLSAAAAPLRIPTLFLGIVPVPHVIGTDAAAFAVLRRVHLVLALLLVALALGHAAMALHHHRRGRAVLARMLSG